MGAGSLSWYLQSRDRVSGNVYLASLVLYAMAQTWVKLRRLVAALPRPGG